jgi:DNA-binding response OmpR family regulator
MSEDSSLVPARRILVIEDNDPLAKLIAHRLVELKFDVRVASDGARGLLEATTGSYSLILLDLTLPGIDGLTVCRKIRRLESYTPIIMLTSRAAEADRIAGLEMGADDYLTKPFSFSELCARVSAMFRRIDGIARAQSDPTGRIARGGLVIDTSRHQVTVRGRRIELTVKEFDLLSHFARHPGRVFSRSELLQRVWGGGFDGYDHTVNTHINRLRQKIECDPHNPALLRTVWGRGYKLEDCREN